MDYAFKEFLDFTPPDRRADTERLLLIYDDDRQSTVVAYVLFFLLFTFGAHRFYIGKYRSAIAIPASCALILLLAQLDLILIAFLVALLVSVLWLIDLVFLSNWVYERNRDLIHRLNSEMLRESDAESDAQINDNSDPGATGRSEK